MSKIERTKSELDKAFRLEIREFENNYNEAIGYKVLDEMREKKISSLALSLRKLLIDSHDMKSLVTQMNIRNELWFSPICSFSKTDFAGNIVPVYPLIDTNFDGKHFYCKAVFHKLNSNLRFNLDPWLNEIVIDSKCEQKYKATRQDIIRIIADKEGGAHYDAHDETYYNIINNFAFEIVNNGRIVNLCNNSYFETLLAIAFEFLESIREYRFIKSLINKSIIPSQLYLIETSYRINGKIGVYNKYVHSQNSLPVQCFCYAFDSNGKASYRLINTNEITFYSVMENKLYKYILMDFNKTLNLVFLRDIRYSVAKSFMLVKNKKGYSIVSSNDDLKNLNKLKIYTLHKALMVLSNNDENIFDYSLKAQYVLEDIREFMK